MDTGAFNPHAAPGLPNERRPVLERGAGYLDFCGLGVASKKGEQAKQHRYDNGRAHGERDAHAKRLDAGGKEFLPDRYA